ncbi:hypothetical protein EL22_28695 [Halostagnicola sp. A56]|uniref:hypothetical protein n=1 Tax=Halostagnicola sp. A56 TaxID=1495067 RepID=UPI00065F6A56|nr:hypothetical protein [Halostagnicola sp. A56]KMT45710.1 hypothetical protein EL22_28695 [Halostagnicola sp. A56]
MNDTEGFEREDSGIYVRHSSFRQSVKFPVREGHIWILSEYVKNVSLVEALELIENGMSYRQAAENTPHVTRQTLSNIDQDEGKRGWYTEQEAEDDRIQNALCEIDS